MRPMIPAHMKVGEVVVADVRNPLENPASRGKGRPVVIVAVGDTTVLVMGLTSKPRYQAGAPRTKVPNPAAVGLDGSGYLWGCELTRISRLDIHEHIGWADVDLAATIIHQVRLTFDVALALLHAVVSHHYGDPRRAA